MTPDPIYLDHNATTPLLPEVVEAMLPFLREHFGNPSSSHCYGTRARAAIDQARTQVAKLLDCDPSEIVFTSGGTEANHLAILGVAEARVERSKIVTSTIEHPAVENLCSHLKSKGKLLTRIGVDRDGRIDPKQAAAAMDNNTCLVSAMHSNNETGVLQPVAQIAELAHKVGAMVHTDAAQSVGKVTISVRAIGVDLLSLAGHKLYAPKGVGALYVRRGTPLAPVFFGAGHENGRRPGTENVASIVGLGVAAAIAAIDLATVALRTSQLRNRLFELLADEIPDLALNGHLELRLPNTLNVRFPRVSGRELLQRASEVAASIGSACHDGKENPSAVLLAMGCTRDEALGSVRLTLGRDTTREHIDGAAASLVRAWQLLSAK